MNKQITHLSNSLYELTFASLLGDRAEQQDVLAYANTSEEGIVVICDGMGGHEGGQLASSLTAEVVIQQFSQKEGLEADWLLEVIDIADEKVKGLCDKDGRSLRAGTTLVCAWIQKKGLHWLSVGDSRMYLLREQEMVKVTRDHNYQLRLDELLKEGIYSQETYKKESDRGEALISFIGMNGVELIDHNEKEFQLYNGDQILMMSDGLYKLVTEKQMQEVLYKYKNPTDAITKLIQLAQHQKGRRKQDNTTIAIITIKK